MTWERAWAEGRTPWDAGGSPPVLVQLAQGGTLPKGRALVPGCGSGYDVLTLASPDRRVLGIDLAQPAVERFERMRERAGVPADHAQVVQADFFSWDPGEPFDLVWDYTFLCALPPERRAEWAARIHELLAPGGELVTLIFPIVDKPADQGPPFAMSPELVRSLLEPRFENLQLEPVSESLAGREGKECLARWRRL